MNTKLLHLLLLPALCFLTACGAHSGGGPAAAAAKGDSAKSDANAAAKGGDKADSVEEGTPVTVTTISNTPFNDSIELNAVSTFLQKSYVKANANGYLQSADVYPGKYVAIGQTLFTLKTKEAQSIGNTIGRLDSSLRFTGVNTIKANQHGYLTQLDHQSGDYVQDGEQLAVISDRNSFVFLLSVPYELRPAIKGKTNAVIVLPDGTRMQGTIGALMPTVDSASQTQNVIIRIDPNTAIPENLIVKVRILRTARPKAQSVPKSAVLTDETETNFWVMKLLDSATAVKVPVKKGIETGDRVELLAPLFDPEDKILITGNYGLPDTAKVKVETNN